MNNPSKSSPESPAKEQPGEVLADKFVTIEEGLLVNKAALRSDAAPDVAAMVKRLRAVTANSLLCQEAAAMIEKLGQGWIPDDALSFCEDCGMYVVSKPPPPERP